MDRGAWQATVHRVTKESDTTEVTAHCGDQGTWGAGMVFESLPVSEGDGWKSSGWERTPDRLRADAPSVPSAQLSLHGLSPLGWPLNCCSPFLLCVAAFLAMANRWQCCLCHETELEDPTAGQVSCPHSGLMSSIREHLAPGGESNQPSRTY